MSVRIYFSKSSHMWDDVRMAESLARLPLPIRERIEAYKSPADRQSRIMGKLLLLQVIEDLGLSLDLDDLKYTEFHKPYFDGDFDFSISHCDGMVACAGGLCVKIGIDTESMREIEIDDYRDELTRSEWYLIHHHENPSKAFLQTWTKKEALLKATGRGIDMDMSYLDAGNEVITIHHEQFSLFAIPADEKFISHIAICPDYEKMRAQHINFKMSYEVLHESK